MEGTKILETLENLPTFNKRPRSDCRIVACGIFVPEPETILNVDLRTTFGVDSKSIFAGVDSKASVDCMDLRAGASPAGKQGGQCPPDFRFCPPNFFLAPPQNFFGRKKLLLLGGKNVKICDFGQKKPSDFGEDLFLFFLEITCFWSENLRFRSDSEFGEDLFFFFFFEITCDFVQKNSAKTFAPLILILPPRSREAGDAPVWKTQSMVLIQKGHCLRWKKQLAKIVTKSQSPLSIQENLFFSKN